MSDFTSLFTDGTTGIPAADGALADAYVLNMLWEVTGIWRVFG